MTVALIVSIVAFVPMLMEARRSRRNERALRIAGAVEPRHDVYRLMRIAYPVCFLAMAAEAWVRGSPVDERFVLGAVIFVIAKGLKYWAIAALGPRWTFRVLVPAGEPRVTSGPYRWMRHPNYAGVVTELVGAAIMAQARITGPLAVLFFGALLLARIRAEEEALGSRWGQARNGVRPDPSLAPPRGARIADSTALVLFALACLVTMTGRELLLGIGKVVLPPSLLLLSLSVTVLLIRHAVHPRPGIPATVAAWRQRLHAYPHASAAVRAFVLTRPAVFFVAYFAVVTFGLAPNAPFTVSPDPLANLPARFDAGWYAQIAVYGYQWDRQFNRQRNIAFFPALPMLMRPVGATLGMERRGLVRDSRLSRAIWAGVIISLVAFAWALFYLSRLTELLAGATAAMSAPLLLAAYPFAVFFNAPYTEGLFLLGCVGAFYHFHRCDWIRASLFGLLVGLSRPNGCLLSIPLAILAIQQVLRARQHHAARVPVHEPRTPSREPPTASPEPQTPSGAPPTASEEPPTASRELQTAASAWIGPLGARLLVASTPGVAMLLFTAYLYDRTGVWFAWARMHAAWGRKWGTGPIAQGWEWLTTEGLLPVFQGVPFDTLNTLAVIFALALTWSVFRQLGAAYGLFVLVNLVPPVFAGGALSMGRITSTLFPLFIVLAARLPPLSITGCVCTFAMLQGLVAALFFTWREIF